MTSVSRRPDLSATTVRQIWVITRIAIFAVAAFVVQTKNVGWSQVVSNWDVQHFIQIARDGYANRDNIAFFPGMPALLRGVSAIGLPIELGGILIGLVSSALAAWALFRMFGGTAASLWMIAPTGVFTAVGYSEAPFCAAAFWAWERARAGRWWQAAALASVACTFRVSGLFLVGALAVMAMTENLSPAKERLALVLGRWVWLLLPVAVLGLYVVYLHSLTGSWNAWFQTQAQNWSRGFVSPIDSLQHTLDAAKPSAWPDRPLVARVFTFEIASMALGLVTTLWMLVRRRWAEASWVGIQVIAFGITYWYMSVTRAVLLWFPLFVIGAGVVRWRPRTSTEDDVVTMVHHGLVVGAIIGLFGIELWWSWLFFTGQWAS